MVKTTRMLTCIAIGLMFTLLCIQCSPRKLPALGAANQLTIVTNTSVDDESVFLLSTIFKKPVVTVDEESTYVPEVYPAAKLSQHSDSRNLVLLTDISRKDGLVRKVEGLLGKKVIEEVTNRGGDYFVRSNIWAFGQTMAIIVGSGKEDLLNVLRTRGEELYADVDSVVTERTVDVTFAPGDQSSMSRYLSSKYDWSIKIPFAFNVAEDEKGRLVKLVSEEPTRLMFVHWFPAQEETLDARTCLERRAKLVWAYYDEDEMDYAKTRTKEVVFLGRKAIKIEGVWQNAKYIIGGPFITFCFHSGGRFYMLDGVVFAPGMPKAAFLKQIESIMLTFKDES